MNYNPNKIVLFLSLPLAILIIITSSIGIFTPDFYSKETFNWQVQSRGQDIVDLFLIVPLLLITSGLAFRNNRIALLIWGGVTLYLTYTFIIFCFNVHFNKLFYLYCLELGLSFYSFMFFLFICPKNEFSGQFKKSFIINLTGIYFLIISGIFYFLWLSEIFPAILSNNIPLSLTEVGLFTNPVHVIDLSVILPGIFLTGIFLLRRMSFGFILAPVVLTFFILMDITIGFLIVLMRNRNLGGDLFVSIIISLLAMFSIVILIWYLKRMKSAL